MILRILSVSRGLGVRKVSGLQGSRSIVSARTAEDVKPRVASAHLEGSGSGAANAASTMVKVVLEMGPTRADSQKVQNQELKFPLSYLRDNCSSNFHASTLQRLAPMCRQILDSEAEKLEITSEQSPDSASNSLTVHWAGARIPTAFPDRFLSQTSTFSANWLLQHSLAAEQRENRRLLYNSYSQICPLTAREFFRQKEASERLLTSSSDKKASADDKNLGFDFSMVMSDDAALKSLLERLLSHGMVFVTGLPHWKTAAKVQDDQEIMKRAAEAAEESSRDLHSAIELLTDEMKEASVIALQNRISYARETNYGRGFHVKNKTNANNQAYTTQMLPLHTDLPFYNLAPDIQMLHCVAQSSLNVKSGGGESTFVDGVAAALKLWEKFPKKYELLKTKKIQYSDWSPSGEYELHAEKTIISEFAPNSKSEHDAPDSDQPVISHIHLNEGVRCHLLNSCTPEEVPALYDALVTFQEIMEEPELKIEFQMGVGNMVIWNNNRVLHGRNAFSQDAASVSDGAKYSAISDAPAPGPSDDPLVAIHDRYRHLTGGYVDWDDALSKMRVLEKRLTH